jgi:hypothetical protein
MEKHEIEKKTSEIRVKILPLIDAAVDAGDVKQAKKWTSLFNSLDRGW